MLALLLAALAALPTEITLREGERRVVRLDDVSLIAVADPDILQASAQGERVTLYGAASGTTELRVFAPDGTASVIAIKVSRTAALPEAAELTVEVGTSKTVPVTPSRFAETVDSKIATVELQGSFLVLRGLSEGRTAILSADLHNDKHTAWVTVTPHPKAPPAPDAGSAAAPAPAVTVPVLSAVGLTVGATTALTFTGVTKALARDEKVVRVASDGKGHVLLTGVAPGTATVGLVVGQMTMFVAVTVD